MDFFCCCILEWAGCVLAFMPIIHALPKAGFWLLAGELFNDWRCDLCTEASIFNAKHKILGHMRFSTYLLCWEARVILL